MAECESSGSSESSISTTAKEIEALKNTYQKHCKVIKDQGDFDYVLNVQPLPNVDLKIYFQLTDQYPNCLPEIIIYSHSVSEEVQKILQELVNSKASGLIGSPMIMVLLNLTADWLQKNLEIVNSKNQEQSENSAPKSESKSKKKTGRSEKLENLKYNQEKKPAMRTASDVVKRLLWDESLPQEYFSVGYLDRFEGVMEKPFHLFSWEDIASVDYTVLAIPKHRIQYFKYRNAKVWDKNERLDIVFGSTGSMVSIQEFINDYNLEFGDPETENIVKINLDSDSSSDEEPAEPAHYDNSNRATHFLTIRITNLNIIEKALLVQSSIKENESRLTENCIPGPAMHITLGVLKLGSPADIAEAVDIFKKAPEKLSKYFFDPLILNIQGIDHFRHSVVYAKIEYNETFFDLVNDLMSLFEKFTVDTFDFVPHMTLVKVSRPVAREMKSSFVNPIWYGDFTTTSFGSQQVKNILLCSIRAEKGDDGFYATTAEMLLDD